MSVAKILWFYYSDTFCRLLITIIEECVISKKIIKYDIAVFVDKRLTDPVLFVSNNWFCQKGHRGNICPMLQ